MIVVDGFAKVIKLKWNIDYVSILEFRYNWRLPPGVTRLRKSQSDRLVIDTSFGIFHQRKLSYNEVLTVLLEKSSGALSRIQHDLIISALTYPNKHSRRTVPCSNIHLAK